VKTLTVDPTGHLFTKEVWWIDLVIALVAGLGSAYAAAELRDIPLVFIFASAMGLALGALIKR
jgi:hypothetical protein